MCDNYNVAVRIHFSLRAAANNTKEANIEKAVSDVGGSNSAGFSLD
jgi:hypothetical protein